MLYLNPPFFQIEGVTVARDYSDPQQYWYYPNRPQIFIDEQGRPALRLLIYKEILADLDAADDEDIAGFLLFDTVLSWDEDRLKRVAAKIKVDQDLDELPRLSPLLYSRGKVRMSFLDQKTPLPGEPLPPPESPESDWVTYLETSGMPSLYGDNRAIFSVQLSAKGARFVLGSFDGFIPAGVIYELDYVAMQRAYQVTVDVDWTLVYKLIEEHDKDRFFFHSSEIEEFTEKLFEDKTINVKVSIEGVGDEGMEGEASEAKKQLTKFIFDKFFEQKVNPRAAIEGNTGNDLIGVLEGIRDSGLPMQFGYSKRTLDTEQLRSFDADMSAYRAVERKVAPQAHLSVFWEDLGVTPDDVITIVDNEDDLFRKAPLKVLSSADFSDDAIALITVEVVYGNLANGEPAPDARVFSMQLDKGATAGEIRNWYDPSIGLVFHYRYTVVFGPKAKVGPEVMLVSPWKRTVGDLITINPAELYETREYLFQRSRLLSKDMFPEVVVQLRYVDEAAGWTFEDSVLLDDQTASWSPAFRVNKAATGPAQYRLQFLSQNGTVETDWLEARPKLNLIDDPRENLVQVHLLFPGSAELEQAIVNLQHSEPDHGIHEETTIIVTKDKFSDAHGWQFSRSAGAPARYSYSYVLLRSDGDVIATDMVETDVLTLTIGGKKANEWEIRPELVGPPLSVNDLDRIEIAIRYEDSVNDYRAEKTVVMTQPGPGEPLKLQLKDLGARDYTYVVTYCLANGFRRKVGPNSSQASFLVVSTVPPP